MGLIIFCALFNLIVWFVVAPIILIKFYDNSIDDFGMDFTFCGVIITILNIIGTLFLVLGVFGFIFDAVYDKYIEFIFNKIRRKK